MRGNFLKYKCMHAEIRKYCEHIQKAQIEVLKHNKQKGVWYWDLPACASICHNGNNARKARGYSHLPQGTVWNFNLKNVITRVLGGMGGHTKFCRNIIGNCAEQHAANNYMNKYGERLVGNLHFSEAVRPRTMEEIPACVNCKSVFPNL